MFTDVIKTMTILVLTNGAQNIGDKNNSLKVSQEIQQYVKNADDKIEIKLEEQDHNNFDYGKFVHETNNNHVCIVVTAGEYGIDALNKLAEEKTSNDAEIISVWSGHMKFERLEDTISKNRINHIIMPKHALTKKEKAKFRKNTDLHLHQTGVPFLLNLDAVKKAANERKGKEKLYEEKSINLILGGDVPGISNKNESQKDLLQDIQKYIRSSYFKDTQEIKVTQLSAREMGYKISDDGQRIETIFPLEQAQNIVEYLKIQAQEKGYKLHITTSGRTDNVIVEWLENQFKDQKDIKYFNHKTDPNAYKAILLHAYEHPEDLLFVTGDSTSVVAESEAFSHNLWIIPVDSMNDTHLGQAANFDKKSYAKLMDLKKDLDITNVENHRAQKPACDHETHDIVFERGLGKGVAESIQKLFSQVVAR